MMIDQQTSRTNITEALRRLDRMIPLLAQMVRAEALCDKGHRKGKGEHYHFETVHEWARLLNADRAAVRDALAAEPRSDALTAPDEPSTGLDVGRLVRQWESHAHFLEDAADATADRKHAAALRGEARGVDWARRILFARYSIEREARAASASVPQPLDEAWSAAEAALPPGGRLTAIFETWGADMRRIGHRGLVRGREDAAAALRDLARATAAETPEPS